MTNDNSVPLTYVSPKTGKSHVVGSAKLVSTDSGMVILGTVAHPAFQSILKDPSNIHDFSISSKADNEEAQTVVLKPVKES